MKSNGFKMLILSDFLGNVTIRLFDLYIPECNVTTLFSASKFYNGIL
jgi:hypothetical protein